MSYQDHTPGQGQYTDLDILSQRTWRSTENISEEQAQRYIDDRIAERDKDLAQREITLVWLSKAARAGRIRLLAHDVVTADEVAHVHAGSRGRGVPHHPGGGRAAKAAGMPVVAGAPNVLRGGSHSGNVGADRADRRRPGRQSVQRLHADHPAGRRRCDSPTHGVLPLPAAVRLITSGAATTAGLTDRGRPGAGQRADLIAVTGDVRQQTVRMALLAEESRDGAPLPVTSHLATAGR